MSHQRRFGIRHSQRRLSWKLVVGSFATGAFQPNALEQDHRLWHRHFNSSHHDFLYPFLIRVALRHLFRGGIDCGRPKIAGKVFRAAHQSDWCHQLLVRNLRHRIGCLREQHSSKRRSCAGRINRHPFHSLGCALDLDIRDCIGVGAGDQHSARCFNHGDTEAQSLDFLDFFLSVSVFH